MFETLVSLRAKQQWGVVFFAATDEVIGLIGQDAVRQPPFSWSSRLHSVIPRVN
jgi:hypothetical protein